jgi:hypothetical protein
MMAAMNACPERLAKTRVLSWLLVGALAGCATSQESSGPGGITVSPMATAPAPAAEPAAPAPAAATTDASAFPAELVAGPGSGEPALFLGAAPDAAAIGYVSEGVVLEIAGGPEGDRIPVRIRGGMRVRGYFPLARLSAVVTHRGRVGGTPLYVGPNDRVHVIGPGDEAGTMRIEGQVTLRPGGPEGPSFTGTFPVQGLGAHEVGVTPESDAPGTFQRLPAGQTFPVYDRPGGAVVYTIPALDPGLVVRVAAQRDGWNAVLVGLGPYIAGYAQATVTPAEAPPRAAHPAPPASSGGVPQRLTEETQLPLYRLPAGIRIRFDGATIAALDREGYARELARYEQTHEVDVFVAVDDAVAVRGMISADDLAGAQRVAAATP